MRLITPRRPLSLDGTAVALSLRDPEAFTAVFDRHFVAVHRYLARRAGRDAADDIASQTFTVAFVQRGRYRDDLGTARPWLFGIATNLLRAELRSAQRRQLVVDVLGSEALHASASALRAYASSADADTERLRSAVRELDPGQRDALLLHVWGELSYEETANALDVPIGTVRSRISRARAQLRAALETPDTTLQERTTHAR